MSAGLRFYDFFAGAGLATLGLSPDWLCVWANDIDPRKGDVYRENFNADHFFLGDVARFRGGDLPNSTQLSWASFPCQDLSLAGWRRGLSADRSGAFWAFWRIMRDQFRVGSRPPIVVIENVVGLLHERESFAGLCEALAALGMAFGAVVIDARHFVPQSRPRVFVIAVDSRLDCGELVTKSPVPEWTPEFLWNAFESLPGDLKGHWRWWNLPMPTGRVPALTTVIERNPTGVEWATAKETAYLLSLMNDKNRGKVKEAQKSGKRHIGFVYKRMREGHQRAEVRFDGVAGCLRTPRGGSSRQTVILIEKGRVRSRLLSPREAARLMGVPDSFRLPGNYNDGYRAMGDAVAVPVVRWLSQHLLTPLAKKALTLPEDLTHHRDVTSLLERTENRAATWTLEVKRKAMKELETKTTAVVKAWFEDEQKHLEGGSDKYVVCAGIAVAQVLKGKSPIAEKDYITDGNQVKTSGSLIRKVLKTFGEERKYVSEGGRTTRGTRPAAERLVAVLNAIPELTKATKEERAGVTQAIHSWLFENGVKPYFNRQKIEVDISLDKPGSQIVADILDTAAERNVAGAVAQHLVGAKLALRYPQRVVENYGYTTADKQLGRPGDFLVGDTVFHVTVAPAQDVIGKCGANIKNGYRAMLLVTESRIQAARQLAEIAGLQERVGISSLEQFVGQNVEEIGEFGKAALAKNIRALLEKYNDRVLEVETDRSLLIEIPTNI
jgi:DNA (cytosine-5)-methyltransferase 1